MQAIYTRTIRVKDDMLGKAMEIGKGLAKVRKKYYPKHQIYFSFQVGGDPRKIAPVILMIVAAVSSISNFALNFWFPIIIWYAYIPKPTKWIIKRIK